MLIAFTLLYCLSKKHKQFIHFLAGKEDTIPFWKQNEDIFRLLSAEDQEYLKQQV